MPRSAIPTGQDWEPQVYNFQKSKTGAGSQPRRVGEQDANRALQTGHKVEIQKKEHLNFNKQSASAGANAKKLDEDHESLKVKKIDHQLRVRIMKARQELGWSQQDLAQKICERASVVTDYESGRAIPEERVIIKMEKTFGLHLRGVKAGEPMGKVRPTPKPKD